MGIISKFVLSNKKKEHTEISDEVQSCGLKECQLSIISKIIGEKRENFVRVKNFVQTSWGCSKRVKVAEIEANLFQFIFENHEDKGKILKGGAWLYDNQLLILKEWKERIEEDITTFTTSDFRIQVWNLPLHWLTKEIGKKIGARFSKVK